MSDLDARRIAGRVAALAERLAAVFGAARTGAGGASLLEAATFLRAMAAGIAGQSDDPDLAAVPPPLGRLAAGLALSAAEVDLVLLACMPDEHEGYASVLRAVSPRGEPRPTLGLAAQLLCATPADRLALRHLADGGAAFTSGLLGTGPIDAPFFERSLTVAEGLPGVLAGLTAWPPALGALDLAPVLAGLSAWLEETTVRSAADAVRAGHRRLVLVTAATEDAALARAAALAEAAGVAWAAFAPSPTAANAREGTERLLALHCLARGVVPVIRLAPPETGEAQAVPALPFLAGPVIVAGRAGGVVVRGGRPVLHVDVGHLPPRARAEAWAVLLPRAAALAPILATRYPVDPAVAAEVAADLADGAAASPDDGATDDLLDRVAASVRVRAHHGLTAGVRLVRPAARWEDLVVSTDQAAQLHEALGRLLNQGRVIDDWGFLARRRGARGVRMLFAGPPGTGKTLSAEVLAGALGTDLLVVDISRVVSKWIGETEKNLSAVFDVAERTQAVLLFDEADALFGKRTEVSDAHDRYANLETAYLLARLESFEGLAVLATNLRQNIDPAFLRRLEFVVDFSEPTAGQREALWRVHLPAAAPMAADLDLGELASRYAVVGAAIRNAAVAAAFLAAGDRSAITRAHIVRAIRREYDKAGKAFPGRPDRDHLS